MRKQIFVLSALLTLILVISGCGKTKMDTDLFKVSTGDTFTVNVSMENSGEIKSMALSLFFDENAFDLIDGKWLNHDAVIADFNKENLDAAIAFKEGTEYYGEIFEFTVKAKRDLTIIDDMFIVEPILKNEQIVLDCKGITVSFAES